MENKQFYFAYQLITDQFFMFLLSIYSFKFKYFKIVFLLAKQRNPLFQRHFNIDYNFNFNSYTGWSLASVFGKPMYSKCPVASLSNVYLDVTNKDVSMF